MKDKLYAIVFFILIILWIVAMLDGCLGQCNPDGSGYGPIKSSIWKK
jgi:hypothetical protein